MKRYRILTRPAMIQVNSLLVLSLAICLPLLCQGVAPQTVSNFDELVASISVFQQEQIGEQEQENLQYRVSDDAVWKRKNAILEKASLIDPGKKSNGKQSTRVDIARLARDITDQEALQNIVTVAPYDGHDAHFTKLGLSYLYGRFNERLPEEVQLALLEQAPAYTEYLGLGTENHISMQRIAASVFGAAFPEMTTHYGLKGKELAKLANQWIQDYGQTVYRSGIHEYLSPIYLGVHNECWVTAAECGPTAPVRLMSQAMLDWIWSDLAVNSHLGQVLPPVTRAKTMLHNEAQASYPTTHAQFLAWLYWGDLHSRPGSDLLPESVRSFSAGISTNEMLDRALGFQTALLPAASELLPNEIIRNLGGKNIQLPYMLLQSRPHGQVLNEVALNPYSRKKNNRSKDVIRNHLRSVYVARNYSLSGGYFRQDQSGKNEQYKHIIPTSLSYRTTDKLNSIIISHPYWYAGTPHGNEEEANMVFGMDCWLGKSPYEQMLHWENTLIYVYDIPDEDPAASADKEAEADKWVATRSVNPLKTVCVYVPESIDEIRETEWGWFMREGDVYIALQTVGVSNEYWEACTNPIQNGYRRFVTEGSLQALVVEVGDATEYGSEDGFTSKIETAVLDASDFQSRKTIRYLSTRNIPFEITFNSRDWFPRARVKSATLDFERWPICQSPYVSCKDGVLRVNDGIKGFSIDWSGALPVYSEKTLSATR